MSNKITAAKFILLYIFILLSFENSLAQKGYKISDSRRVYITPVDKKIEAFVNMNKKPKTHKGNIYYWYDNTTIQQTQGGYSGYLLDGQYLEYLYPSNKLSIKGNFRSGLKNGLWMSWYANGKLKEQVEWKKGKLNGIKYSFDTTGKVTKIEIYKHGNFTDTIALKDTSKAPFVQAQLNKVKLWFKKPVKQIDTTRTPAPVAPMTGHSKEVQNKQNAPTDKKRDK